MFKIKRKTLHTQNNLLNMIGHTKGGYMPQSQSRASLKTRGGTLVRRSYTAGERSMSMKMK